MEGDDRVLLLTIASLVIVQNTSAKGYFMELSKRLEATGDPTPEKAKHLEILNSTITNLETMGSVAKMLLENSMKEEGK